MPIGVNRHLNASVTHLFFDVVERCSRSNQHRTERVTKVMEPNRADSSRLERGQKSVPNHIVGMKYAASLRGENKVLRDI